MQQADPAAGSSSAAALRSEALAAAVAYPGKHPHDPMASGTCTPGCTYACIITCMRALHIWLGGQGCAGRHRITCHVAICGLEHFCTSGAEEPCWHETPIPAAQQRPPSRKCVCSAVSRGDMLLDLRTASLLPDTTQCMHRTSALAAFQRASYCASACNGCEASCRLSQARAPTTTTVPCSPICRKGQGQRLLEHAHSVSLAQLPIWRHARVRIPNTACTCIWAPLPELSGLTAAGPLSNHLCGRPERGVCSPAASWRAFNPWDPCRWARAGPERCCWISFALFSLAHIYMQAHEI